MVINLLCGFFVKFRLPALIRGFIMAEKLVRTRNWATIVYDPLDSWLDKLKDHNVPFFVSPLHDSDVSSDGQPKKPHYHVLLMFDGVKTKQQAAEIFDTISGVGCERVSSLRGYARYLCHLDDMDKHQYSPNDVICYGATADYVGVIGLPTDRYDAIADMMDWVDREHCISYARLLRYAKANNEIWFRCLCDNATMVMREYIKSFTWELDNCSGD